MNDMKLIAGAMLAAIFSTLLIIGVSYAMNRNEVGPCTVTGKESVVAEGDNQYRVYTEECGTFIVKDTLFALRFNSADTYSSLKDGESYQFRTQGFRLGITSTFPNILDYAEN